MSVNGPSSEEDVSSVGSLPMPSIASSRVVPEVSAGVIVQSMWTPRAAAYRATVDILVSSRRSARRISSGGVRWVFLLNAETARRTWRLFPSAANSTR